MKLPTIEGVIDRRVLVNFRVEPRTMAALLPSSLRPQLVDGWAIAGICLIRLQDLRPASMLPGWACGRRTPPIASRWSGMKTAPSVQACSSRDVTAARA